MGKGLAQTFTHGKALWPNAPLDSSWRNSTAHVRGILKSPIDLG
jgi:hypothetical protein